MVDEEVDKLGTEEEQERFNEIVGKLGRKPKVLNKRTDQIPPDAVYVGRPSKWGNPFKVEAHTKESHQVAVNKYRVFAISHLAVEPDWLLPLKGKDLVCWCTPLPCHADVLLELANKQKEDKCHQD